MFWTNEILHAIVSFLASEAIKLVTYNEEFYILPLRDW